MRVTWLYREASKHPLAVQKPPSGAQAADSAASGRLLLSLVLCPSHAPPPHSLICSRRVGPGVCPACIMRPA